MINEAGGKSINLNGQELEFNKEKTLIEPGIIAGYNLSVDKTYKELNKSICDILEKHTFEHYIGSGIELENSITLLCNFSSNFSSFFASL